MKAKLDTRTVARILAQKHTARLDYNDTTLPGFCLRVTPTSATYYVRYLTEDGVRRWHRVNDAHNATVTAARAKAKQVLRKVEDGADPFEEKQAKRKSHTLASFIEEVYKPWAELHRKAGKDAVRRLQNAFPKELQKKRLTDIKRRDLMDWKTARTEEAMKRDNAAVPTARHRAAGDRDLACLKAALSHAVKREYLRENPLLGMGLVRVEQRESIAPWTDAEEEALWAALADRDRRIRRALVERNLWLRTHGQPESPLPGRFVDFLEPYLGVLLYGGLRRSEGFRLRWGDLDLEAGQLTVRAEISKSGRQRVIPLCRRLRDTLAAWREQHPAAASESLVFPNAKGESYSHINSLWRGLCKAAGIRRARLHDARHAFASRLIAQGVDPQTVRELLGHSSLVVTGVYLHSTDANKRRAVESLDRMPAGNVVPFPASDAANGGE